MATGPVKKAEPGTLAPRGKMTGMRHGSGDKRGALAADVGSNGGSGARSPERVRRGAKLVVAAAAKRKKRVSKRRKKRGG